MQDYGLRVPFADFARDMDRVVQLLRQQMDESRLRANFQVQVLSNLFFRNKAAYIVGKIINSFRETPFALPLLFDEAGKLYIDTVLQGEADMLSLFSFARAYFLVDMEIPSAYVHFLRSLMPHKPRSELYNALGLGKQGKTLFFRDFYSTCATALTSCALRPASRAWSCWCLTCPRFPTFSKSSKTFTRRKKKPRASKSATNTNSCASMTG